MSWVRLGYEECRMSSALTACCRRGAFQGQLALLHLYEDMPQVAVDAQPAALVQACTQGQRMQE